MSSAQAPIMTRSIAIVLALAGCRFDADYGGGTYACSDGVCPEGLVCNGAEVCVEPGAPDAAPPVDAVPPDAEPFAFTCADPGIVPRGESVFEATTIGDVNHVSGSCDGIHNGPDDVYLVVTQAGDDLEVQITGETTVRAYVVVDCVPVPSTPACTGGMVAQDGFALTLNDLPAGDHYVLVDEINPVGGTDYTLTVTLAP
jgi:hypothetical protein